MPTRIDRGVAGLVFTVWVAMTASACLFVARNGYNLPRQDEWEFVDVLTGDGGGMGWVFARHAEHRFPLARAVYLGLHSATGRDFRAGMWLTVFLLSASAAVLARLVPFRRASRGRGERGEQEFPYLVG